jgi:hypothetical protein
MGTEYKLLSVKGKRDITNMVDTTLKMFLTKENDLCTLHFCINLKYKTWYSNCKCRVGSEKGENSKMWLGRISPYGLAQLSVAVLKKHGNNSIQETSTKIH